MWRFISMLALLILSVWLGLKIAADPGYALFSYRYWSVEMPLWFAVLSFVVFIIVIYFLLRFFDGIDFSLYRLKNWLRWRRKNKSYSKTNRGLIELIEGRWRGAELYLLEGVQRSDAPLVNFLAAAKAAHEQEAFDRRDNYLRKAHDFSPRAELAIGLTQAQLQLDQGQLEQALATLKHLYNVAPRNTLVLKLLERLYIHLGDWAALLKLLPNLRKAKLMTAENADKLERSAYRELLQSTGNKANGIVGAREVWEQIPKKFQGDTSIVFCYVKIMSQDPSSANDMEALLNKTLKKSWDPELVKLYGLLPCADSKKQLSHAEGWLKRYGNQALLFLTLGRLCMRCQLWGKARNYFEESLKLEPLAETYFEYGKLLDQLGDASYALKSYRDGLGMVVSQGSLVV